MYEEGPDAFRAKSPGHQIREAIRLFRLDMTSTKEKLYEGCVEFKVCLEAVSSLGLLKSGC